MKVCAGSRGLPGCMSEIEVFSSDGVSCHYIEVPGSKSAVFPSDTEQHSDMSET